MKYLVGFLRFWYDFIVGDDWRIALSVAAAIGLTALLVRSGISAWWLMPIAVVAIMLSSLRRAIGASE
jgi:ribonucleotide monophosphatase NagD (HAD superfamily)